MTTKAILFDLDGTLLDNSLESFTPPHFRALVEHLGRLAPADSIRAALSSGVRAMDANAGSQQTNKEVFIEVFCAATGVRGEKLESVVQSFYTHEFARLAPLTRRLPEARSLVAWAMRNNIQVAVATGMQTPKAAIEHRLSWAGIPITDFAYAYLTAWDNMHASKPHPAYFQEVLARVGRQPAECIMVGDDWEHDIQPAISIGIPSYWISASDKAMPAADRLLVGKGTLADFSAWLTSIARKSIDLP